MGPQGINNEHGMRREESGKGNILIHLSTCHYLENGFPDGSVVKKPPANSGDARDTNSILDLGRSLREGNDNHSSIPAWEIS